MKGGIKRTPLLLSHWDHEPQLQRAMGREKCEIMHQGAESLDSGALILCDYVQQKKRGFFLSCQNNKGKHILKVVVVVF